MRARTLLIDPWARSAAWLLAGGVASVLRGQDRNWDLLHYHLYLPFALLEGRLGTDLLPVGLQGTFPPLLDLPYYLLAVEWLPDRPRVVAFLAGLPFGALGALVHALCRRLAAVPGDATPAARETTALAAALLGMTGSTVWSELGTTFGDLPVAALIVAALLLAWRGLDSGRPVAGAALAGLLLGLAVGLKPTAATHAPALALAILLAARTASGAAGAGWRVALAAVAALTLASAAAFALSWGWWGAMLWARFGNPVFPLMNHVFAAPLAPAVAMTDARFLPRTPFETLAYPFFWLRGRADVVSETGVADARFALAYLALLAVAARAAWARWRPRATPPAPPPGAILLLVFVPLAYAAWQGAFSILRYAAALEALTGAVLLLAALAFGFAGRRPFPAAFAALAILLVATSEKQNWGRLRSYGARVVEVSAPPLPDGAVVAVVSKPTGFVLPFLRGCDLVFIGLVDLGPDWGAARLARDLLASGRPIRVLSDPAPPAVSTDPAAWGLVVDDAACVPVTTNLRPAPLRLCPATPR